jgi:mono/diheme cytochrome c family protein
VRTPRQDMPAYRKQHLSDKELADIYAYVRSIKAAPDAKGIPLLLRIE